MSDPDKQFVLAVPVIHPHDPTREQQIGPVDITRAARLLYRTTAGRKQETKLYPFLKFDLQKEMGQASQLDLSDCIEIISEQIGNCRTALEKFGEAGAMIASLVFDIIDWATILEIAQTEPGKAADKLRASYYKLMSRALEVAKCLDDSMHEAELKEVFLETLESGDTFSQQALTDWATAGRKLAQAVRELVDIERGTFEGLKQEIKRFYNQAGEIVDGWQNQSDQLIETVGQILQTWYEIDGTAATDLTNEQTSAVKAGKELLENLKIEELELLDKWQKLAERVKIEGLDWLEEAVASLEQLAEATETIDQLKRLLKDENPNLLLVERNFLEPAEANEIATLLENVYWSPLTAKGRFGKYQLLFLRFREGREKPSFPPAMAKDLSDLEEFLGKIEIRMAAVAHLESQKARTRIEQPIRPPYVPPSSMNQGRTVVPTVPKTLPFTSATEPKKPEPKTPAGTSLPLRLIEIYEMLLAVARVYICDKRYVTASHLAKTLDILVRLQLIAESEAKDRAIFAGLQALIMGSCERLETTIGTDQRWKVSPSLWLTYPMHWATDDKIPIKLTQTGADYVDREELAAKHGVDSVELSRIMSQLREESKLQNQKFRAWQEETFNKARAKKTKPR